MFQILCTRKRETVSYIKYVYVLDFLYQKEGNCIIPIICICSKFCVPVRGKLYHTYNMSMFQILCTRKRETVSYIKYVYVLDFVYQKEGNYVIPIICLCSRFCVPQRGKLYHTCNMSMFQIFLYQKEINCIIPTICLCSRFCA